MTNWIGVSVMVLGLFLVLPLLGRSRGRGPDLGLALFLLALMINDLTEVLPGTETWDLRYRMILIIASQLSYPLYGPLLLHYVRRVTGVPFHRRELGHFVPALVWTLLSLLITALLLVAPEALLAEQPADEDVGPALAIAGLFLVQTLVYCLLALKALRDFRRRLTSEDSPQSRRDLLWLQTFLGGSLLLWGLWLASTVSDLPWIDQGLAVAILVFFYSVGWFGWFGWKTEASPTDKARKKYVKSGMSAQEEALVAERVARFLEEKKAYLREDLTLGAVAKEVGCSPHWVSQYLNETRATTFFDYVNGLRVAEFVTLAGDPANQDRTVLELATASGFRSKSTFNLAFKAKMGLTPLQWREQKRLDGVK